MDYIEKPSLIFLQKELSLRPYRRGFHLITTEIVDNFTEIKNIKTGMLFVLIKHTSAGICLNENADPDVRQDFQTFMNHLVPDNFPQFIHTEEGPDDMSAHIKSTLMGHSLQIPITGGRLNLGTWQGIYLGEFRNQGGSRKVVLTAQGLEGK